MLRRSPFRARDLRTILFTDIVGSTERAVELGDRRWREVVAAHHAIVRRELRAHGGREVDTSGDGFFVTFERPAEALACAVAISTAVHRRLGLAVRAGIHTGEVERIGEKRSGIAVHIAARIMAAAAPGEVLVSSTVRDLVSGSEARFDDRGMHHLKGVPEPWHLYALIDEPRAVEAGPEETTGARAGRSRTGVLAVILAFAAAGAVAAFLIGRGAFLPAAPAASTGTTPAPSLPNGPNTLVALAPDGRLVQGAPIGAGPRSLGLGGGLVWVASLDAGTVSRVDQASGRVDTMGGVGRPAVVAVDPEGIAWVADPFGNTVVALQTRGPPLVTLTHTHAVAMAVGYGSLWMADDVCDRLIRVDLASRAPSATIELPPSSGPNAVAVAAGSVWVTGGRTKALYRIDPAANRVMGLPTALIDPPTSAAASEAAIWIASETTNHVSRISTADAQLAGTFEVGLQPSGLAAATSGAWVACGASRQLWRLDNTGSAVQRVDVAAQPEAIALDGARLWVALGDH